MKTKVNLKSNIKTKYIVTVRGTGTMYLQQRSIFLSGCKYRWGKTCKERATVFSESGARGAVKRYGGKIVRV